MDEMLWTLLYLFSCSEEYSEMTGLTSRKEMYERLFNNKVDQDKLANTKSGEYIGKLDRVPNWFFNELPGQVRLYMDNDDEFYSLINDLSVPDDKIVKYYKHEVFKSVFKKYGKILSTYLTGIMVAYNYKVCPADENLHSNPYFGEGEYEVRSYPPFQNNSAFTKRWSSGYHTIPSESQVKRVVGSPKGYGMSYFDISQAEVRSVAYLSGDPKMIEMYESGEDLYIYAAKQFNPDYKLDDPAVYGYVRGVMKMVLLGLLYGIGTDKLSEMTQLSKSECQRAQDTLLATYPKVKEFIERKSNYAVKNRGYIETILGDIIKSNESKDKIARQGINACIQNFTSVALVYGFMNILRESDKIGKGIQSIITVHDSGINYFRLEDFWSINNFYHKHFTDFLYNICGVKYEFKTLVGENYWDMGVISHESDTVTTMKGSATTILKMCNKFDEVGIKYELKSESELTPKWRTPTQSILDYPYDPHLGVDKSYYKVEFHKL